jgi:MFS family permease
MSQITPVPESSPAPARRSRLPFVLGGLAALLCAQVLYGALVLSALHKQYAKPMQAVQTLVCEELGNRLGRMTRLGKEPGRIAQLESLLASYRSEVTDSLLVLDAQKKVLAGWGQEQGTSFSLPAQSTTPQDQTEKFSRDGYSWLTRALYNQDGALVGHLVLGMDDVKLSTRIWPILQDNIKILGTITLAAILLLILITMRIGLTPKAIGNARPSVSRPRLYLALLAPLVLSQLFFAGIMVEPLRQLSRTHLDTIAQQLGRHLKGELEHIVGLGLTLEQLPPVSEHLQHLQQHLPEAAGLGILTPQGELVHAASAQAQLSAQDWTALEQKALHTEIAVSGPDRKLAGRVRVLMSPQAINTNIWSITLDTLTMTVVAVLFLVEMYNLLLLREERAVLPGASALMTSPVFMRTLIFLCLLAIDLSLSFVPLRIAELDATLFSLPTDVVLGLPVSVEMFMVGLAILVGGFISEETGWRPLFLAGIGCAALGNLGSGLTEQALMYIGFRGLAGSGYGLINLAAQVFVLAHSQPDQRATNLATVFAGLFAGALCGSASGGLIADRLGYAATFIVAAIMLALMGAILWRVLPAQAPLPVTKPASPSRATGKEILGFLADTRMAALLFLHILPSALVTVCLFQFFIPVSLHQSGASPADIGRVVMLFPLVIIYLGPVFGQWVDSHTHKYRALAMAGFIATGSVLSLLWADGLLAATMAVLLLGLGNAVLSNAQGAYALELPVTERFGPARAVGIYNVVERLGQVIGPIALGTIIAVWGRNTGLGTLALGFAGLTLIFALISSSAWRKKHGA